MGLRWRARRCVRDVTIMSASRSEWRWQQGFGRGRRKERPREAMLGEECGCLQQNQITTAGPECLVGQIMDAGDEDEAFNMGVKRCDLSLVC